MATKTGRYVKRTETLKDAYQFDDKDFIEVLIFLSWLKGTFVLTEVWEGRAQWIVAKVIEVQLHSAS